ncbi:MAG: C2H2-type zinc finger protein [Pseudomonadota bacterium]
MYKQEYCKKNKKTLHRRQSSEVIENFFRQIDNFSQQSFSLQTNSDATVIDEQTIEKAEATATLLKTIDPELAYLKILDQGLAPELLAKELSIENEPKLLPSNSDTKGVTLSVLDKKHERTRKHKKSYQCDICGRKEFVLSNDLKSPYRCDVCRKNFSVDEKPYFCNICSKKFSRKAALTNHKKMHPI